jgi:probable rRNA maturation factor
MFNQTFMHMPPEPSLELSLQFGKDLASTEHKRILSRYFVTKSLNACLQHLKRQAAFTVRVVGLTEGLALNQSYRERAYATNVLTFSYESEPIALADLVLCAPVILKESKALNLPLQDHYRHLLIHGALHALGYDHETSKKEARIMEALEIELLKAFKVPNPYAL